MVLYLINNRTRAFCSILKISFVSDWCDISLDFVISLLKIRQILTELQYRVNHETSELLRAVVYLAQTPNKIHQWNLQFFFLQVGTKYLLFLLTLSLFMPITGLDALWQISGAWSSWQQYISKTWWRPSCG